MEEAEGEDALGSSPLSLDPTEEPASSPYSSATDELHQFGTTESFELLGFHLPESENSTDSCWSEDAGLKKRIHELEDQLKEATMERDIAIKMMEDTTQRLVTGCTQFLVSAQNGIATIPGSFGKHFRPNLAEGTSVDAKVVEKESKKIIGAWAAAVHCMRDSMGSSVYDSMMETVPRDRYVKTVTASLATYVDQYEALLDIFRKEDPSFDDPLEKGLPHPVWLSKMTVLIADYVRIGREAATKRSQKNAASRLRRRHRRKNTPPSPNDVPAAENPDSAAAAAAAPPRPLAINTAQSNRFAVPTARPKTGTAGKRARVPKKQWPG